jgi:hypothetical protein
MDNNKSKSAVPREQLNIQMVWLDSNIDENSADYRNTITQLRRTVSTVNTFIDRDQWAKNWSKVKDIFT